jgi:hypothetical protein
MINNNTFFTGLILGILVPSVGYFLLTGIFEGLETVGVMSKEGLPLNFRARTTTLIAICMNLIPFSYFNRKRHIQSMRGIILPTIAFAFLWVFYFGQYLFS